MSFIKLTSIRKVFPDGAEAVKDIDLEVRQGEFVVLIGPSGCGKTTTLRMIAGLETPTSGRVLIDGKDATRLRPAERDIGFVFQFYSLYPHLTVRGNLLFPLENAGLPRRRRIELVEEIAGQMGIRHLLERHPAQLSGGDQQKVSVARAMVRRPKVWLMDEPLGTIDADRRRELREWIREKQLSAGVTTVYVTHDQEEAMSLADRVVVMNNGLIEQMDAPLLVYDEPASVFAADFIGSPGMNLFRGAVKHFESWSVFCVPGLEEEMAILRRRPPGEAVLGIRAEFIEPNPAGPFHGTVVVEEYQGSFRSVHFDIGLDRLMVMRADPNRRFHRGERVRLLLHPKHVRLFDPVTGRRLPNG